jgi:hypothetical protein
MAIASGADISETRDIRDDAVRSDSNHGSVSADPDRLARGTGAEVYRDYSAVAGDNVRGGTTRGNRDGTGTVGNGNGTASCAANQVDQDQRIK